jgi:type II secretory pathway component PulF
MSSTIESQPALPPQPALPRRLLPLRVQLDQRSALLRLIAVSLEEKIPLAPLLSAWAVDERGWQRRRLRRLTGLLRDGVALPEALEQVRGVLKDEDVLAVRFGSQSGTLAETIRQRLGSLDLISVPARRELWGATFYFWYMVVFGGLILTFFQLRVAPTMLKIRHDFDASPSATFDLLQGVAGFVVSVGWLIAIGCLLGAWLLFATRWGRSIRSAVLRPMRQWQAANVLELLGTSLHAGRPLAGALSTLARYHFDPAMRHRLLFARNELEQGVDPWESLAAVRVLSPQERQVMETATRVGNRDWALGQLAQVKKGAVRERLEQWVRWMVPALVFLVGIVVLCQAAAVFTMLVQFSQSIDY